MLGGTPHSREWQFCTQNSSKQNCGKEFCMRNIHYKKLEQKSTTQGHKELSVSPKCKRIKCADVNILLPTRCRIVVLKNEK